MDSPDANGEAFVDRPPANRWESLWANCRPQPAIPAAFVMFLFVLLPVLMQSEKPDAASGEGWLGLLVAAGIVGSCALAVAAGYCSVFPQVAWFGLAWWCLELLGTAAMPVYIPVLLVTGMAVVTFIFGYQLWRVRTNRFTPTIREEL